MRLAPGGFLSMTNAAARKVRSPRVVNVQDFRSLARRRLPKVVFDYLDGGAEDEISAVNGRIEVLMDGGIRRGADIVKAICLGARAVLCGRAYAYGLAAAGQAGVARALEILREDLNRTLRLLGCPAISALDHSYIDRSAMRNTERA